MRERGEDRQRVCVREKGTRALRRCTVSYVQPHRGVVARRRQWVVGCAEEQENAGMCV